MRIFGSRAKRGASQMRLAVEIILAPALLIATVAAAVATPPPPIVRTENRVESLALEWFERMRTGDIDRTQLTSDYSAQLTDDAVHGTSQYLKKYEYGASPTVMQRHEQQLDEYKNDGACDYAPNRGRPIFERHSFCRRDQFSAARAHYGNEFSHG